MVRHHPGRPILLLVDTQGQRLSHRDELLGINGYMAHLAKCLDLAARRRSGHRILGLVYSHAVSGGFLASMLADTLRAARGGDPCDEPAVHGARHEIPLERLAELSASSPVFAPGVDNYLRMGAIEALWEGDLAALPCQGPGGPGLRRPPPGRR